ncbi:MAG: DUF3825 domain-containing protein [Pseudorhodoplanes sp.]
MKLLDDAIDRIESGYRIESKAVVEEAGVISSPTPRVDQARLEHSNSELRGNVRMPSPDAPNGATLIDAVSELAAGAPVAKDTGAPVQSAAANGNAMAASELTDAIEGIVLHYSQISWQGRIRVHGEAEPYYFDRKSVQGQQHLMKDERVRFSPSKGPRRPRARNVELIGETPWVRGEVKWWDLEKGFGIIASKGKDFFAHYSDVCMGMGGERYLDEGEAVIFRPTIEKKQGETRDRAADITVFTPRHPCMRFAIMRSLKELIPHLAEMAVDEPWEYSTRRHNEDTEATAAITDSETRAKEGRTYLVLEQYVIYTLNRLVEENKIVIDGKFAYANIGLQTKEFYADIVAQFTKYTGAAPQEWELKEFVKASNVQIARLPKRPELAEYITNPSHLIFDCKASLAIEAEHIIRDNRKRLESIGIQPGSALREINDAKNVAIDRVRRNYKIAIPSWRRGQIQLLLPLCLKADYTNPELALVVNRAGDNYHAPTALTIAQAYTNARLIARPDPEWLRP